MTLQWGSVWGTEIERDTLFCKLHFLLGSIEFAFPIVFCIVRTCRKEQRNTSAAWVVCQLA
jgi:hypothetical protein